MLNWFLENFNAKEVRVDMCLYITSFVPANSDIKLLRQILYDINFNYFPISNDSLNSQLGKEIHYFISTKRHCDCGSDLGSANFDSATDHYEAKITSNLKKLREKGWSEAKIQRWISDIRKAQKKDETSSEKKMEDNPTLLAKNWLNLISQALTTGNLPYFGILLHDYSGSIYDDVIGIRKTLSKKLFSLDEEYLLKLERDVLYKFIPK